MCQSRLATNFRSFYPNVDTNQLMALVNNGWTVAANLHFGNTYGKGLPPHLPHRSLPKYIEHWRTHEDDIGRFDQTELRSRIRKLQKAKIVPRTVPASAFSDLEKFPKVDIRPGIRLTFKWSLAEKLPSPTSFAPKVRSKIDEALRTWGAFLR